MSTRRVVDPARGRSYRLRRFATECGKTGYAGRKLAAFAAAEARRNTAERIEAYKCLRCRCWHIGHPPGSR